jgi:hypothetical protein
LPDSGLRIESQVLVIHPFDFYAASYDFYYLRLHLLLKIIYAASQNSIDANGLVICIKNAM